MNEIRWYLSFSDNSLSMIILRSIHVAENGIILFFLWLSNIPLYICTTSLSIPLPMDIQVPCPGYCKQCCNEFWGTHIFSNYDFLWIYAKEQNCCIIRQFCFQFFKETPQWLYQFTFPQTVQEGSFFSTASPIFIVCRFFLMMAILTSLRYYFTAVF